MYEISVVSYQGEAPADRIVAVFGEDGGTIGRGPGNTLVLPDPNRFVSRLQAKIAVAGERLAITNASSANPLLVNDREVDAGSTVSLGDGDEVRIGLYLLRVRRVAAPRDAAADRTQPSLAITPQALVQASIADKVPVLSHAVAPQPSLDPLQVMGGALGQQPSLDPLQVMAGALGQQPSLDPLQVMGGAPAQHSSLDPLPVAAGATSGDPFADLIPAARAIDANLVAPVESRDPTPAPARGGAPVVPDQVWDELARMAGATHSDAPPAALPPVAADFDAFAAPSASARNPADPLAEFAQSGVGLDAFDKLDAPIDAIFNDAPAQAAVDDVIPDPHAAAPDPLATPESVDPIAIFGGDDVAAAQAAARAFTRSEPDQVPELEAFFRPAQPPAGPPAGVPVSAPLPKEAAAAPRGAANPAPASSAPSPGSARRDAASPAPVLPSSAVPAPSPPARAPAAGDDALLRAFLAGAGIPNAIVKDGLTPETMKAIGAMLATAMQGTIELIATRAMLKREVKADVTIIATTRNNPLKFLPDAESALLQMFGARIPGFMAPVEAMQDAYRDLRAHEVGLIAGMRAALAEVLHRFEPEELEKRLKPPGMLESILPNSHQARLWDAFSAMYGDISREAQDDFQALFGKAFLQAYEHEVARLKGS